LRARGAFLPPRGNRVLTYKRKCLLDSSFLIDLLNEMADAQTGPAFNWLQRNASTQLWITPVSMAEVLQRLGAGYDDYRRTAVRS
jgi:hypothetical protein